MGVSAVTTTSTRPKTASPSARIARCATRSSKAETQYLINEQTPHHVSPAPSLISPPIAKPRVFNTLVSGVFRHVACFSVGREESYEGELVFSPPLSGRRRVVHHPRSGRANRRGHDDRRPGTGRDGDVLARRRRCRPARLVHLGRWHLRPHPEPGEVPRSAGFDGCAGGCGDR